MLGFGSIPQTTDMHCTGTRCMLRLDGRPLLPTVGREQVYPGIREDIHAISTALDAGSCAGRITVSSKDEESLA